MKTIVVVLCLMQAITLQGQSEKFKTAMTSNLDQAKAARTIWDYQQLANNFGRISVAEKTEWIAWYYAAFYNLVINFQEPDPGKRTGYVTLAQQQIEEGLKLQPDETELMVLKVMSYYAEMAIDPMKGMTLLGEANALIDKAKTLNANNPRIYLEQGEAIYAMPAEFGGGKEKALPILLLAKEKFDKFVPADSLSPDWGKDRCAELLSGIENSTLSDPVK